MADQIHDNTAAQTAKENIPTMSNPMDNIHGTTEDISNKASGYKATMHNPNVKDSTKADAKAKFEELGGEDAFMKNNALVIGASDGIDKSLIYELAKHGFNIVLHGRNPATPSPPAASAPSFATPPAPQTPTSPSSRPASRSSISPSRSTKLPAARASSPLAVISAAQVDDALNTNARFPAQLTRALLPRFVAGADPCLILNLGWTAHSFIPYASVYGGSKACNQVMSSSLCAEMLAENLAARIEILSISLAGVTEARSNKVEVSLFVPDARTMARACLARVGYGRAVVVGYWAHAVQLAVLGWLPMGVTHAIMAPAMRDRWDEEKRKNA